ncbi:MAG: hypothetical protein EXQ92_07575 [Alphaproteobacteria bacterium]|nr:hypothetical protein [Alphaproteobacteria bacterium]
MPSIDLKYVRSAAREGDISAAALCTELVALYGQRFSTVQCTAMNYLFALHRDGYSHNRSIPAFFDPGLIQRLNLNALLDGGVDRMNELNEGLEACIRTCGLRADGHGKRGINDDERLIVDYGKVDLTHPSMKVLLPCVAEAIARYKAFLVDQRHAFVSWVPPRYQWRVFAAATRGGGWHYPHLHSGAWLVASYYVRVPSDSQAFLQFGTGRKELSQPFHAVRPAPGDLVLFSGYFTHATTPPHCNDLRLSIGLDIQPLPLG